MSGEQKRCPKCDGALEWATEITAACPWGTGYLIEVCEKCGAATGELYWVGF